MLSPQTLERVSSSYRRGYYDGYEGKPNAERVSVDFTDTTSTIIRPFANHDYREGYKAGANDKRWTI